MSFLRSKSLGRASALMLGALLSSCAASRESTDVTAAFAEHTPRSIRIFTVFNQTTDERAPGIVERLVERKLKDHGYGVVQDADAMMHVAIEEWSSSVDPWHGHSDRTVTLNARLYDAGTGALLWSSRQTASDDEEDDEDEGGLVDGLFDYVVDSTTEVLLDDWGGVGDDAVGRLLDSLPRAPR